MALPGFRDFYPDDCAFRNAIFAKWREIAHRYGFVEYDGPPLEPLDLFTKKSGDEIVHQLYHFKDKGDREVALRPEMTPTLARLVTARHKDFKKPLKWFSIPQVYRYERPQKGRGREHYQFNCDIIGEASLEADVELIALVVDTLRAFGLTEKDFVVRLSDRQFWTDFMNTHGVPEEKRYAFIQAIDKSEREPREKTAEKLGPLADEAFAILADAGRTISERLDTVEAGLRHRGLQDYVKRDYTVVRGLAYYTGVVFEVFDRSGEFRAIAGGGRYDTLLKNLGGVDLPALGFGMGDVVLGEILKKKQGFTAKKKEGVFVVIADDTDRAKALAVVQRLRETLTCAVDYSMTQMRVGRQFQRAEESGCAKAIIVDDLTLQNGVFSVKDLSSREQHEAGSLEDLTMETLFPPNGS
ncbi:MAG: histidine--tRNA ligase [Methylacidiphilales bacterium]|nr:histidine--tRNA ligase [Candidatus Methylacidiphilales bacterium]